jgi:predicted ribosome quality control (RQC) complex YloA/Tae2 family protein
MAFGPELVFIQASEMTRGFRENRVRRANAGDLWMSLTFPGDATFMFSWDPEFYGVCHASPAEIRKMEDISVSRPPLLDAIKSHIVGADLFGASQLNRDRVLKLEFRRIIGAGFFQTRYLVCEVCGRYSNIILIGEDGLIIESAKHILPEKNRYRTIIPGHTYTPPPKLDGVSIDDIDLSSGEFSQNIGDLQGIGRPFCRVLEKLTRRAASEVIGFLKNMNAKPCYQVYPHDGNYVAVSPKPLPDARVLAADDSFSAARETVITPLMRRRTESRKKKITTLLDAIERSNEKRIAEYAALASGASETERLKIDGRMILENASAIPRHAISVTLTEWTDEGPLERTLKLDPGKDAIGNAESLFAKYKRKKSAAATAAAMLPKLYQKGYELKEQRILLERNDDWNTLSMMRLELERPARNTRKIGEARKNTRIERTPHRRAEFPDDGAVIFWGLSAKGNRYVTFKLSKADDIWLHAQNTPGTHVLLRFGVKPDEATFSRIIQIAASCAVFYSGYRGAGKTRVDFTERRHVRAIQGAGAANVTYKEFRTIMADSSLWCERERQKENI